MGPELQQKLFDKYPKIFEDKDKSPQQTAMCWGIETGDGWFDIIDKLCYNIQNYIDDNKVAQIKAIQVKEKYGTLRFYTDYYHNMTEVYIQHAENKSAKTCEVCGKPGKMNTEGWITVRCDQHTDD